MGRETGLRQRKVREGIESLRERHHGMRVLNTHEQLEMWKPILNDYFELERKHFPALIINAVTAASLGSLRCRRFRSDGDVTAQVDWARGLFIYLFIYLFI